MEAFRTKTRTPTRRTATVYTCIALGAMRKSVVELVKKFFSEEKRGKKSAKRRDSNLGSHSDGNVEGGRDHLMAV